MRSAISILQKYVMYPKKIFVWFQKKNMGGGLTSVVQNYFDKGVQTSIMSCPDADLIVEVLHVPRIQELVVFETSWRK